MKHECASCETLMVFEDAEGTEGGSLRIAFACPNCGNRVFLIANAQETQLVKSMGIRLGKMKEHQPLGLVRSTLRGITEDLSSAGNGLDSRDETEESGLVWDDDAEKLLERAPAPVRAMARIAIERYALQKGRKRITAQVVAEAREKMGL